MLKNCSLCIIVLKQYVCITLPVVHLYNEHVFKGCEDYFIVNYITMYANPSKQMV